MSEAAKAFFDQAHEVAEQPPQRVADGHTCYFRAIEEELREAVDHEVRDCRGSLIEQSYRGIK